MGGIAALAKAAGHRVTGSDANVYPPMSTQLKRLDVQLTEGWDVSQLDPAPDCVVIGNAMSRANPVVEAVLNRGLPYRSGPQWLSEHVLKGRHVFAVAGTHGKTTTTSMLAWILEDAGLDPGFLIGGLPANFDFSARLGTSKYFVVEADEYDTAFFDKRAKFVHYQPRTVVLNNLEFDHADIYRDLDAILWQFHQLLRIVPGEGRVLVNGRDPNLARALGMGCWTPVESFGLRGDYDWVAEFADPGERRLRMWRRDGNPAEAAWKIGGSHNLENALAAVAAAQSAGVPISRAVDALSRFDGVRRRMERTATVGDVAIFDDFAHHPTAIRRSIEAIHKQNPGRRVVVALEPRSNTMKMGIHNDQLASALDGADLVAVFRPDDFGPAFDEALAGLGDRLRIVAEYDRLVGILVDELRAGDLMVFMSNGGFGASRQKLTLALQNRGSERA